MSVQTRPGVKDKNVCPNVHVYILKVQLLKSTEIEFTIWNFQDRDWIRKPKFISLVESHIDINRQNIILNLCYWKSTKRYNDQREIQHFGKIIRRNDNVYSENWMDFFSTALTCFDLKQVVFSTRHALGACVIRHFDLVKFEMIGQVRFDCH